MSIEWKRISKFLIPIFIVVLALAIFGVVFTTTTFATGYSVYADGERLGSLATQEEGEQAVQNTESKISEILQDEEYSLPYEIEYQKETVEKTDLLEQEEMESILYDSIPDITDNYVLKVDDEVVGMNENPDVLQKTVDDTVAEYVNENTTGVEVISDTEIVYDTVSADTDEEPEVISSSLSAVSEEPEVYTVQQGDTMKTVMENNDMSTQNLLSLNPDLEEVLETEKLSVEISNESDIIEDSDTQTTEETFLEEGTEIVVSPEQHTLVVETREIVSSEETIPYETTTIEDENMYQGETEIRTEGVDGIATQKEIVTYQNGVETDREDSSYTITAHPIDEVIAVGTKEVPEPEQQVANNQPETVANDTTTVSDNNTTTTVTNTDNSNNDVATTTTTTTANDNNTNNTTNNTVNNNNNTTTTVTTNNDNSVSNTTTDNNTQQTETYTEPVQQETTTSYSNMDLRNQVVAYAMNFLGCSYVHGGHGPYTFDCSGLTGYVYAHFGISLPWTVEGQYACGTYVPLDVSQMLPGDLIFWSYGGSTPTHVGMYIGNGQYIQATKPGDVVRINTVSSYAGQPLVGCRRIIQ